MSGNILDRNFVDLDTKRQIEFNRQKNVQQDQRLKAAENVSSGLQQQINLISMGKLNSFLPLVWTRTEGTTTWRTDSVVVDGTIPAGGVYQLVPDALGTADYISTIVELTDTAFTILIDGDYPTKFTTLKAYSVITGQLVGTITVSQSRRQSSTLESILANEKPNTRVKVMNDLDSNQREYISVDLIGDGRFSWIRYGTLLNGINGRNIFRVTGATIKDVKAVAHERDVLIALEDFTDGDVLFLKGDVGLYLPLNTPYFISDGNIAIEGKEGKEGKKGDRGFNGTVHIGITPQPYPSGFPNFNANVTLDPSIFQQTSNDAIPSEGVPVFWIGFTNNVNVPQNQAMILGMVTASSPTSLTVNVRAVMAFSGTEGKEGKPGIPGRSIASVVPTRDGTTTTVVITMDDNTTVTFNVEDGESALPFVIAQGIFTLGSLPTFTNAAQNTAYVVLNTSPPTNTYDLYIKAGSNTNWTIVTSWGGVQGEPGLAALTYNVIRKISSTSLSVPSTIPTVATAYNRLPNVGETALHVVQITNTNDGQTINAIVTGTVTSVGLANDVIITVTSSSVIPSGTDGASVYQVNLGSTTTAPTNLAAVPYALNQMSWGNGAYIAPATGTQVLVTLQVSTAVANTVYLGFASVVAVATSSAQGTLNMTNTPWVTSANGKEEVQTSGGGGLEIVTTRDGSKPSEIVIDTTNTGALQIGETYIIKPHRNIFGTGTLGGVVRLLRTGSKAIPFGRFRIDSDTPSNMLQSEGRYNATGNPILYANRPYLISYAPTNRTDVTTFEFTECWVLRDYPSLPGLASVSYVEERIAAVEQGVGSEQGGAKPAVIILEQADSDMGMYDGYEVTQAFIDAGYATLIDFLDEDWLSEIFANDRPLENLSLVMRDIKISISMWGYYNGDVVTQTVEMQGFTSWDSGGGQMLFNFTGSCDTAYGNGRMKAECFLVVDMSGDDLSLIGAWVTGGEEEVLNGNEPQTEPYYFLRMTIETKGLDIEGVKTWYGRN